MKLCESVHVLGMELEGIFINMDHLPTKGNKVKEGYECLICEGLIADCVNSKFIREG